MTTNRAVRRIAALLPGGMLAASLLVAFGPTSAANASGWVDGADEFPCLDDVTCLWIEGCELDENQHPVYPNRNGTTSYPAGSYSYQGDAAPTTPTPTAPTKPTPTKPTKPTPTKPTPTGSSPSGTPASPGATTPSDPAGDLGLGDEQEQVAAGAPSALAAPVLTVKKDSVTVTWEASPNAELEQVTGYLVRFTGLEAVEFDATTFTHTFKDLEPGSYRAAVWAENAAGVSAGSPPSEPSVVGDDPASVPGTVTATGEVAPGAVVTLTGAGFAPRIEGFEVELHSTPVALGTVSTDDQGGFALDVTIPATVAAGDHEVVVLFEGAEVSRSPVTVVAAAPAATGTGDTATVEVKEGSGAPVPDHAGLFILGGLGAAGALSLAWHLLRGRRRPTRALAPA